MESPEDTRARETSSEMETRGEPETEIELQPVGAIESSDEDRIVGELDDSDLAPITLAGSLSGRPIPVAESETPAVASSFSVGLAQHLAAVLFAGGGPVKMEDAARALGVGAAELEEALRYLRDNPPLGLRVQRHTDELELVSDPRSAHYVEALLGLDRPTKLSRAALETLAIVAYRQPVTRSEIEAIRGVNSDSALTTLLNRGLISEVGRRETVGRPALYGATPEFLQHLGLDSMEDLPPLPE